ncbi:sulfatase [Zobellia galactanivorans]|uniref:sulfatase family protein n=1 Tax=Zobellia galactanivorans (strain DSM 12802 / CCUG 47099 / CIP 106680 / NCIMB 13871 / Dsij) TaxID=63186 RepID=UPI0026E3C978|nr:sulfatase [Zobellia galactanivorans]MDO6807390.1 sulfatase [Zobellia galactanivorans]
MRKSHLLPLLISSLLWVCSCTEKKKEEAKPAQERPNIVFIIADDMAWDDSGAYGHPNIQTPNIDQLAKDGMRFDNAFLTTSSCSPSRTSIITGLYPHNTDAEQLHWPLPTSKITFVEQLKKSGYWTAQAGKWHLGDSIKTRFDLVKDVGTHGFQLSPTGEKTKQKGDGSGCEEWVPVLKQRPQDQPFFLWLAAVDPHRPYDDDIIANPHALKDVVLPPYFPDTKEVREDFVHYYNEITRLDNYVGQVVSELDRQGVSDNTMILFISDNGRPFPRDKTTLYDGGIKTPWIVKWPKKVEANSVNTKLVSAIDIAPTFLKLAGLEALPSFEGKDFSPLLEDPKAKIRDLVYAEDHWHDYEDYTRAVRTEEFKYIRNFYTDLPNTPSADAFVGGTFQSMRELKKKGELNEAQLACFVSPRPSEELYDVVNDPYELKNLAEDPDHQKTLKTLRSEMNRIRKTSKDSLPDFRTPDEFDRKTGKSNAFRKRPRPSKVEMEKIIRAMPH